MKNISTKYNKQVSHSTTPLKTSLKAVTIPLNKYSDGISVGLGYISNS